MRARWKAAIRTVRANQVRVVDETYVVEHVLHRGHGWAPRGCDTIEEAGFDRFEKCSVLTAYTTAGYLPDTLIKEAFVDCDGFYGWL